MTRMVCVNWLVVCVFYMVGVHSNKEIKHGSFIRGTYHAWWIILGVDQHIAVQMLNGFEDMEDVRILNKSLEGFPPNQHPVLFEIGKEIDCGPSISSALRSDFLEFKFEIPFVSSPKSKFNVLNYKQRLFESSYLNSVSSKIMYGLDASRAKMQMTNTSYHIDFDGLIFKANFSEADDPLWINARDFPLFKPYEVIMNLTWFGRRKFGVCAQHYYDFDTALVRPSNSFIAFNKSMINPYFPLEKYSVSKLSASNIFGAIQIKVNFTMTLPEICFE